MQIHELETFIGTPSESIYLAVDDGTETAKIPMTDVGVSTEMTQAEAETGTETAPRVISPAVLNSFVASELTPINERPYVTEEGSSGNWAYRKWSTGKIELWLHETGTTLAITGSLGNMYQSSANITRSFPSAVSFSAVSFSDVNIKYSSYSVWTAVYACSTTSISFRAMSALSRASASGYTIDAYIVGQGN